MKQCINCNTNIDDRHKFCSRKCSNHYRVKNICTIPENDLRQDYIINKKEVLEIAQKHKCSVTTVFNYIDKYKIPLRGNYFIDFTGMKLGKLLILEPVTKNYKGGEHIRWKCRCDCSKEFTILSSGLKNRAMPQCFICSRKASRSSLELKNHVWNSLKQKASKRKNGRGIEFLVTREYAYELFLKQNRKCALSGVDIKFAECSKEHLHGGTTASLDRIDSNKGYTEDNVQWVHKDVNRMKWNLTQNEFIDLCKKVTKHNGKSNNKNRRTN